MNTTIIIKQHNGCQERTRKGFHAISPAAVRKLIAFQGKDDTPNPRNEELLTRFTRLSEQKPDLFWRLIKRGLIRGGIQSEDVIVLWERHPEFGHWCVKALLDLYSQTITVADLERVAISTDKRVSAEAMNLLRALFKKNPVIIQLVLKEAREEKNRRMTSLVTEARLLNAAYDVLTKQGDEQDLLLN